MRKLRHSEVKTHSQGHTEVAEPEFEPTTAHELNQLVLQGVEVG